MNHLKKFKKALLRLIFIVFFGALGYLYLARVTYLEQSSNQLFVAEKYAAAAEAFKQLCILKPFSIDAKVKLGQSLQLQRRYSEAKEVYERIFRKTRSNLSVMGGLSVIYISEKNYKKAESINQAILKISPHEYTAWLDLAEIYRQRGDYGKAEEFATKAVAYSGGYSENDVAGLKKIVELYNESGRFGEAITVIKEIDKRTDHQDPLVFFELGKTQEYFKDAIYAKQAWLEFLKSSDRFKDKYARERILATERLAKVGEKKFLVPPSSFKRVDWGALPDAVLVQQHQKTEQKVPDVDAQ